MLLNFYRIFKVQRLVCEMDYPTDFGMDSFITEDSPIHCFLKQRYSDFIVHEISPNGDVVRLTDTSAACCGDVETVPVAVEDVDKLESLISEEEISDIELVIAGEEEQICINAEKLTKVNRTEVHKSIRQRYSDILETTTVTKDGKSFIRVMKTANASKGGRKRKQWPKERPDYLHFVLFKENKDSHQAISILASLLHRNSHDIKFAGTKDKRAVTSQKCCMYRIEVDALARLNFKLKGMRLGNFSYEKEELHLGQTQGNMFEIILRDVKGIDKDNLVERLEKWKTGGFINYFGSQRFGTTSVPTWEVGRAIIKSDWEEAVNLILKPRIGGDVDLTECYEVWEATHDAELALNAATGKAKRHSVECLLLRAIIKHGVKNYYNALNAIPRSNRSMYVHSYQSIIWNKVVSKRVQQFGLKVIPGDIVQDSEGNESSVLKDGVNDVGLHQIVLPLPSSQMSMPNNELFTVSQWYIEMMEADGINLGHLDSVASDYALHGATRLVFMPLKDCKYELLHYLDETKPLMETDLDRLKGKFESGQVEDTTEASKLAVKLEFALPSGCYATVALRELTKCDMSKQSQCALEKITKNE